jgi:hypothetical protein
MDPQEEEVKTPCRAYPAGRPARRKAMKGTGLKGMERISLN